MTRSPHHSLPRSPPPATNHHTTYIQVSRGGIVAAHTCRGVCDEAPCDPRHLGRQVPRLDHLGAPRRAELVEVVEAACLAPTQAAEDAGPVGGGGRGDGRHVLPLDGVLRRDPLVKRVPRGARDRDGNLVHLSLDRLEREELFGVDCAPTVLTALGVAVLATHTRVVLLRRRVLPRPHLLLHHELYAAVHAGVPGVALALVVEALALPPAVVAVVRAEQSLADAAREPRQARADAVLADPVVGALEVGRCVQRARLLVARLAPPPRRAHALPVAVALPPPPAVVRAQLDLAAVPLEPLQARALQFLRARPPVVARLAARRLVARTPGPAAVAGADAVEAALPVAAALLVGAAHRAQRRGAVLGAPPRLAVARQLARVPVVRLAHAVARAVRARTRRRRAVGPGEPRVAQALARPALAVRAARRHARRDVARVARHARAAVARALEAEPLQVALVPAGPRAALRLGHHRRSGAQRQEEGRQDHDAEHRMRRR